MSEIHEISKVGFVRLYQAWVLHRFAKWVTSWEQSEGYSVSEREKAAYWAREYADVLMHPRRQERSSAERGDDRG